MIWKIAIYIQKIPISLSNFLFFSNLLMYNFSCMYKRHGSFIDLYICTTPASKHALAEGRKCYGRYCVLQRKSSFHQTRGFFIVQAGVSYQRLGFTTLHQEICVKVSDDISSKKNQLVILFELLLLVMFLNRLQCPWKQG